MNVSVRVYEDFDLGGGFALTQGLHSVPIESLPNYETAILDGRMFFALEINQFEGLNSEFNRQVYNLYRAMVAVSGSGVDDGINLAALIAETGSFESAIDALNDTDSYTEPFYTLKITETIIVDVTKTIPAKYYTVFSNQGAFYVNADKILTIEYMSDPGNREVCQGPGKYLFAKGATGGFYRTAWRTGNASSGDISSFFNNLLESCELNQGGEIAIPTGKFLANLTVNPRSASRIYGVSSNYNSYVDGAAHQGGTTLEITEASGVMLMIGTQTANSANNQRSLTMEKFNVELTGAAATTGTGLLVTGGRTNPTPSNPQQNIYGIVCRDICFIGGNFNCNFNLTLQSQVEEVLFDHCGFIGGNTECFRNNTINSSFTFIQPYVAALPNKVGMRFIAVGALNIINRHIVGAGAESNPAEAAIIFGLENTSQTTDIGDVVIDGGYDERCRYSWKSYAYQDKHSITINGGVQQGKIKHYGVHNANLFGGTYFRHAFEDDLHPFVLQNGSPAPANSRFMSFGAKFRPFTYETATAASIAGVAPVADGPAGQPANFSQYSQFIVQIDSDIDALINRKQVKILSSQTNDWITGLDPHKVGMLEIGSTQANRSGIHIGDLVRNPSTGVETFSAWYDVFRATNSLQGQQGFLVIASSQTGAGNSAFRGVDLNGTYKGNSLWLYAKDGLTGNALIEGNAIVYGTQTANGGFQTTGNYSAGVFAAVAKFNAIASGVPQYLWGHSLSVYGQLMQDANGVTTLDSIGATPKFSFAKPVEVSGNVTATGVINAVSGFQQNGVNLNTSHVPDSTNRRYVTDAEKTAIGAIPTNLDSLTDVTITSPANDDFIQRKSGVFVNRTLVQVKADLLLSNTNTGDETATTIHTKLSIPSGGKLGEAVLFDYGSDGNETANVTKVFYSSLIAANTLSANNQKLTAIYTGKNFFGTKTELVDFAGVTIFDLNEQGANNESWTIRVRIQRLSSSTANTTVEFFSKSYNDVQTWQLSSLNFTTTNLLRLIGSGDSPYNILVYGGSVSWRPGI